MTGCSELRITRAAKPEAAKPIRQALRAFLDALGFDPIVCDDILTAVGEAIVNAIEHAYDGSGTGDVEVFAHLNDGWLTVDVCDRGRFIERERRADRGFGMPIVRAIARAVSVDTSNGTAVHMLFDGP